MKFEFPICGIHATFSYNMREYITQYAGSRLYPPTLSHSHTILGNDRTTSSRERQMILLRSHSSLDDKGGRRWRRKEISSSHLLRCCPKATKTDKPEEMVNRLKRALLFCLSFWFVGHVHVHDCRPWCQASNAWSCWTEWVPNWCPVRVRSISTQSSPESGT